MKKVVLAIFLTINLILFSGCTHNDENTNTRFGELNSLLDSLTRNNIIPGISLSVFTRDSTLFLYNGGFANISDSIKVDENTLFEAASLSKQVFAHLYLSSFQNLIPIDSPLSNYQELKLTNYPEYASQITPLMLLSHQSGLPNWRGMPDTEVTDIKNLFNENDSLNFKFTPGTKFGYSGEGYIWLQEAMESIAGKNLETIARDSLFSRMGLNKTSFIYKPENFTANPYNKEDKPGNKQIINTGIAPASLHSNAKEFTLLIQNYLKHESSIFEPLVRVDTLNNYTIGWAPGIGTISNTNDKWLFQWGDNGDFKAYLLYNLTQDLGVVYFVNSTKGLSVRNQIVKKIFKKPPPMFPNDYSQL
ncbi:serine hydrolase domain-containing protein [Marinigracilibium pacificum]|uniref:Beta-lactamase family protein n=1 Tax=Marinigracilibium pacificum TaxID=2729599 RepID=A0A848J4E2_9BACT|nr:serine hydrolase domain-containing protein [Marinigracilibium pacificum]NMM49219.1 beta-lactamase family protein [Marinigracilibium pacificum]